MAATPRNLGICKRLLLLGPAKARCTLCDTTSDTRRKTPISRQNSKSCSAGGAAYRKSTSRMLAEGARRLTADRPQTLVEGGADWVLSACAQRISS
eukprot:1845573-Prymnesium_polylepis.1